MIEFVNVTKSYSQNNMKTHALHDVSFHVQSGEIFGLLGESGAGKSTALKLINGLMIADSGSVSINGIDLAHLSRQSMRSMRHSISMVFQDFNLLNNRTVYENIALALKLQKKMDSSRIEDVLQFVKLSHKKDMYPSQLSGGERQRVALARAIVTEPAILVCDEPTSALDPQTTSEIIDVLKAINRTTNTTIIVVTHDLAVAKALCHRVCILDHGSVFSTIDVTAQDINTQEANYAAYAKAVLTQ